MGRLINFDSFTPPEKSNWKGIAISSSTYNTLRDAGTEVDTSYKLTLNVLIQNNPNKIMFSIKEAADVLGVGDEFIRRRIKSGKIKATYLGDKPLINIVELARIITEGV